MNVRILCTRSLTALLCLFISAPSLVVGVAAKAVTPSRAWGNRQYLPPGQVPVGLSAAEWDSVRKQVHQADQPNARLSPNASHEYFGGSVSLDGDTLAVGADGDSSSGNTDQGAAYIFLPQPGWD